MTVQQMYAVKWQEYSRYSVKQQSIKSNQSIKVSINQSIQQTYVSRGRKMFKTLQEGPTLAQRQSLDSPKNRNTSQKCPEIIEQCARFQKAVVGCAFIISTTKCIIPRGRVIFNLFPQRWQPYPQQVRLFSIREEVLLQKDENHDAILRWSAVVVWCSQGSIPT